MRRFSRCSAVAASRHSPSRVRVRVTRGEVSVTGRLDTKLDAELLPRLVERVPGVVSVTSDLTWEIDEEPLPTGGQRRVPLAGR